MATSLNSPSSVQHSKESASMADSPLFSPASDKQFWSNLRGRIDTILDHSKSETVEGHTSKAKRFKDDSKLLLKGFDSISRTLSQLSNNLDNALQGAKDLAKPPTLTDIFHASLKNSETKPDIIPEINEKKEEMKKGVKRKLEDDQGDDESNKEEKEQTPKEKKAMKRAKNIAILMASKASSLARELKSINSDLCFMQERCALLEEENNRLRDGFVKGVRPEEDDLVRLQLEALLGEKSRLASENANLVRENQCLHQLVEYHQITAHDLSASYEQAVQGMCLDFSSPSVDFEYTNSEEDGQSNLFELSTSVDESFKEEQH